MGKGIKDNRENAGLTQEELAKKLKINRSYLSTLEKGGKSPTITTLLKIANALGGVKLSALTGEEDPPSKEELRLLMYFRDLLPGLQTSTLAYLKSIAGQKPVKKERAKNKTEQTENTEVS